MNALVLVGNASSGVEVGSFKIGVDAGATGPVTLSQSTF